MIPRTIMGALPSQEIRTILKEWMSTEYSQNIEGSIQPASFDPVLSLEGYIIPCGWKPHPSKSIRESLAILPPRDCRPITLSNGCIIVPKCDCSWLVFLEGKYVIPESFWTRSSPKSTEGRLGNLVQLVADKQTNYDDIFGPYEGELAVIITPRAFLSTITPGLSVNQLRFFCGDQLAISDNLLRTTAAHYQFVYEDNNPISVEKLQIRNGLELHVDLVGKHTNGLVGFRALPNPAPIDRSLKNIPYDEYFEPIFSPKDGKLVVEADDRLLILNTIEQVRIPSHLAAEMDAIVLSHGGLKWHEAGFFDPGFGFGKNGEVKGRSAVIEVHALGNRRETIIHGQGCGKLIFQPVRMMPDKYYGEEIGSNYHEQKDPRLAKYFSMPKIVKKKE